MNLDAGSTVRPGLRGRALGGAASLIATFVGTVAAGILLVGYLFNAVP